MDDPLSCIALDEAIDELSRFLGVLGFQFERKRNFLISHRVCSQIEKSGKMNEMCVIDINRVYLSNRFTFRGDNTDISLDLTVTLSTTARFQKQKIPFQSLRAFRG